MLFNTSNIEITKIHDKIFSEKELSLDVVRLDKIHPVVSGNKLFKLHYFLERATQLNQHTIVTYGGAYSNHICATAYTCNLLGLKSIGIIRGENFAQLSHTLQFCKDNGMELIFNSRQLYTQKNHSDYHETIEKNFGDCAVIPEGGFHALGAQGAATILQTFDSGKYDYIICDIGTATTIAGILSAANANQKIIGVPVLKGMIDIYQRINRIVRANTNQLTILDNYHFGGYAKKTSELISFMNTLYRQNQVPTDFVYTGKQIFAIFDAAKNDFFKRGSKIACLHNGGLQGNLSLPKGTLIF